VGEVAGRIPGVIQVQWIKDDWGRVVQEVHFFFFFFFFLTKKMVGVYTGCGRGTVFVFRQAGERWEGKGR